MIYDETPPLLAAPDYSCPHILSSASHKSEKRKTINESEFKIKDCDGGSNRAISVGMSVQVRTRKNIFP